MGDVDKRAVGEIDSRCIDIVETLDSTLDFIRNQHIAAKGWGILLKNTTDGL